MLDKTYDAAAVEPRVYDRWEKAGAFRAGAGARAGAAPYSIVIPPPNVTGSLHMGHALNNTLQDILVRFERMRGRDVLWQPGTDHAGIATQMVVERQMMERQEPNRRAIGREKFIDKVWAWKQESGGLITNQLKRLGCSCDWSRERFTMGVNGEPDDQMVRAVTRAFVRLFNTKGPDGRRLIYKDKRLVNWDPALQTAISDLEVDPVEVKGKLWHFRYPIEGRTFDPADRSTFIVVATTRPETMLGDTGVAVHPDDPRYKDLVDRHAILPLVGRRLRIVADEYADPETGSGAVKITPAHDFNDFEVGKRHGLRQVNILDREANVVLEPNAEFTAGVDPNPEIERTIAEINRLDRFVARKRVVAMMEEQGLIEKVDEHIHTVPHGDRSGVSIEPYLTDQWYVDAKTLAQPAIASVREGRTVFVPRNWEKTYFEWMENIQPWCISRQLWWGHQIPAWYHLDFGPEGTVVVDLTAVNQPYRSNRPRDLSQFSVVVAESEANALDQVRAKYPNDKVIAVPSMTGAFGALNEGKIGVFRDEDVLDTWFSSALWPFSTLGWPEETPELARYYPTTALVTGFDIIFFWVARMMMMGLHFMDKEPFGDVYIHALVRDAKGAKMSKSKGNVIDPLDLIDAYGADALRFSLAAMAAQGRDIKLATSRVEGYRNFATKLWNAARFAEHYDCRALDGFDPASAGETLNRWIATEATRTARAVTAALEAYKFNEAAAAIYRFVWNTFCDWYVELSKPVLAGEDGPQKAETRATVAWVLDRIVKLLHPFMPFITEELWDRRRGEGLVALGSWPDPDFADDGAAAEINWLIDLITAIRSVRSEMNVPAAAMVPLSVAGGSATTLTRLKTHDIVVRRLARADAISLSEAPLSGAVQVVVGEATVSLPLAGIVDIDAERARLAKELDRMGKDIAKIEAKLGNQQFTAKAPEAVVEEQRERLAEASEVRAKTAAALARLAGLA
ncbi:MAG: valine--tRNA ligase [Bauldia sp.]